VNFKKQTDDQKNCSQVFKMAMNIGWVPFYKNKDKSIEIHILNNFGFDFYGEELRAIALGYIREEMDFKGIDTLIAAIADDVEYSKKQLENPTHKNMKRTHSSTEKENDYYNRTKPLYLFVACLIKRQFS